MDLEYLLRKRADTASLAKMGQSFIDVAEAGGYDVVDLIRETSGRMKRVVF